MGTRQTIVRQFKQPKGRLGKLAGHLMANRKSNIERNKWVVDLMELKDNHHVLEIGYGPGMAVDYLAQQLHDGKVVGIDHSDVMFEQANRRNKEHVTSGKVKLMLGTIDNLNDTAEKFDRIFSSNVVHLGASGRGLPQTSQPIKGWRRSSHTAYA